MRRLAPVIGITLLVCAPSVVRGAVVFSNVTIQGSLSTGATFVTNDQGIDFFFPEAEVGDDEASRVGNILITYEATSTEPLTQDNLFIAGELSGSGTIFVNEVIEDLANPSILATHNTVLDSSDTMPYSATLVFSHAATHIKVKKTLFLSAVDTDAFDRADVDRVGQQVPEPSTLVLAGLGGIVWAARRRRG